MTEEGREEERLEPVDGGRNLGWSAGTLTALSAILIFAYTVANDPPESLWGIVFVDSIFVVLTTIFILVLNRQLAEEDRRRFLRGPKSLFPFVAVIFAVVAGGLAGRVSTAEKATSAGGSGAYARYLREEIRKLQSVGRLVPSSYAGSRGAYAEDAHGLGAVYDEVVSDLRQLQVDEGDRAAHRRLVHRLAAVGRSYEHLGKVAAERSASQAQVDAARDRVRTAMKGVRYAEEGLELRGYRIFFPAN